MDLKNATHVLYETPVFLNTHRVNTGMPINGISIEEKTGGSLTILHVVNQGTEIRISYTTVPSYKINILRQTFNEGSVHNYDNNQFIVTNYGETIDTRTLGHFGVLTAYTVEVTLLAYSYLLAKTSVKLTYPTNGTAYIPVQLIASTAGISYNGFDFHIPVVQDSANTYFNYSLDSEIQTRLFEFQHVVEYNYGQVKTRPVGNAPIVNGQVSPIQISGSPPQQYSNAVINWAITTLDPFRNDPLYMISQPVITILPEGDFDVTVPPSNISGFTDESGAYIGSVGLNDPTSSTATAGTWFEATKALHMVFDNGGVTKELKLTKKVNGAISTIQTWKYGFMFTAYGLAQQGGSPSNYWRCIEYTLQTYNYSSASTTFGDVQYQDRTGQWNNAIVSPQLRSLINNSKVGYLVSINTTGYKYLRFQNETFNGSWNVAKDQSVAGSIYWGRRATSGISLTSGSTTAENNFVNRMLNTYLFRSVPIFGSTQYHLVAADSLYNDLYGNVPKAVVTTIDKVPWSSLPLNLQNSTTPDAEGYVGIARPDPNSAKEFLVLGEATENITLAWQTNPLSIQYSGDQISGTSQPTIPNGSLPKTFMAGLKPYVVGESTSSKVTRQIIPTKSTTSNSQYVRLSLQQRFQLPPEAVDINDTSTSIVSTDRVEKYIEYTTNKTASGANFTQVAGLTTFSELEGRPPSATIQRTQVIQQDIQIDPWYRKDTQYYYTCLLNSNYPTDNGTATFNLLQINQADIAGTKKAIDFKVAFDNALNTKELTVDLGYYRPEYQVGNITSVLGADGIWLIKRVEHGFDFSGKFLIAKPTKITLGRWYDINSQITTSNFTQQNMSQLNYRPNNYQVLGTAYAGDFNRTFDISISGDRGQEQPQLSVGGFF